MPVATGYLPLRLELHSSWPLFMFIRLLNNLSMHFSSWQENWECKVKVTALSKSLFRFTSSLTLSFIGCWLYSLQVLYITITYHIFEFSTNIANCVLRQKSITLTHIYFTNCRKSFWSVEEHLTKTSIACRYKNKNFITYKHL